MLFVEPEPALTVLAVLEMVLAIVWLPSEGAAPEGSVALPATTLRVGATSRRDEAAPCGVYELSRRAALWAERRWLVSCAGTSPVLRTRRSLCPVRG